MMLRIKSVEYIKDYKLKVLFSDKKTKIVDLEEWINKGGVYLLPLRDTRFFKKVNIDKFNYSICWPNGADFSPDVLYSIGEDVKKTTKKSIQRKKRTTTSESSKPQTRIAAKSKL